MRLLVAEDDEAIRSAVVKGLREAGHAVDATGDGQEALLMAEAVEYDLLILDIGLPGRDGLAICRRLKDAGRATAPVLFLTARDTVSDRVRGLDAGADDYLVKPFAFAELLARVRALLRRGQTGPAALRVADLVVDPATRTVERAGQQIQLTAKEFALLEYLASHAGRVLSKGMIAEHVWDFELAAESNFIEVLVYAVRKKVDAPFAAPLIHTVRGAGYRLGG